MQNPFYITDTYTLLSAIDQITPPATFLLDRFFPNKLPVATSSMVAVEYRKGHRVLAPYVVKGARGAEMSRTNAQARIYNAPMIGARRILTSQDLEMRQFGESPVISTLSPQERAAQMQARDLVELTDAIYNRRNKMAADILTEGKTLIEGYADDGTTILADEIDFNFDGIITPTTNWSVTSAKIYDNIKDAVDAISAESNENPDIMICGRNIEKYLLSNKQMQEFLQVTNRQNLSIIGITPKYISPQARYLGTIPALNLEMYAYLETYWDAAEGKSKPFIPADSVIIGKAGRGNQIFGAVTLIDRNLGVQTYAAEMVPHYYSSEESQTTSVSVYSRCIVAPYEVDSWKHIKTCGNGD